MIRERLRRFAKAVVTNLSRTQLDQSAAASGSGYVTLRRVSERPDETPPPILRSWARLYALVLGLLAVWIALFYAFTVHFRPGE